MHELSVTESILSIALQSAKSNQASKVTAINLVIGPLASIVDDSVQFYWDMISDQTICKGAVLNFARPPAEIHCQNCGADFEITRELIPCPACQSLNLTVLSGKDFFVDSIEIER